MNAIMYWAVTGFAWLLALLLLYMHRCRPVRAPSLRRAEVIRVVGLLGVATMMTVLGAMRP